MKGNQLSPADDARSSQYIQLYMNPAQLLAYNFNARQMFVQAGRATGKTDFIITPRLLRVTDSLPRGVGIFLGNTIKQLFSKTLPGTISAIERTTPLREGIHFFRGQPPRNLNWEKPLSTPREWSDKLCFYNGFMWHAISMEIRASGNGLNSCSIISDEARYQNGDKVKEEILPTLRGLSYDHPNYTERNPFYKSMLFVSDAPITAKQAWMQEFEKKQTTKINREIIRMLADLRDLPELADPEIAPLWMKKLQFLQCRALVYFNFSTLENVEILGEQFIKDMKMNLSDFVFSTSILNQRVNKVEGCYYFYFDPDGEHGYLPSDASQKTALEENMKTTTRNIYDPARARNIEVTVEEVDLEKIARRIPITKTERKLGLVSDDYEALDCRLDTDLDARYPLRIALDWGSGINCMVIGQVYPVSGVPCINVEKSMYVKGADRKLRTLCREFCDYYEPFRQKNREVWLYYDHTAKQGANYADEDADRTRFYNIVKECLSQRGWNVRLCYIGQAMAHSLKFQWMEDFLTGKKKFHLRMNLENCSDLIIAMRATSRIMRSDGIHKNKSGEKRDSETGELTLLKSVSDTRKGVSESDAADTVQDLKQFRTDVTDAFDTLVIGCHKNNITQATYMGAPLIG